jgi:hypothetical protein
VKIFPELRKGIQSSIWRMKLKKKKKKKNKMKDSYENKEFKFSAFTFKKQPRSLNENGMLWCRQIM